MAKTSRRRRALPPVPPPPLPRRADGKGPRNMRDRSKIERRELGRLGGLAAQAAGKGAPDWTREQAREHARRGGLLSAARRRERQQQQEKRP